MTDTKTSEQPMPVARTPKPVSEALLNEKVCKGNPVVGVMSGQRKGRTRREIKRPSTYEQNYWCPDTAQETADDLNPSVQTANERLGLFSSSGTVQYPLFLSALV